MHRPFTGLRLGSALFLCILAATEVYGENAAQSPAPVPMAPYRDPAGEVSFECPAGWKLDNSAAFYIPPYVVSAGLSSRARVVFSPAGNVYEKTNLSSLIFVYAREAEASQQACAAMVVGTQPRKTETMFIHGVPFHHFETTDGGMCHDADQHVYWTYRAGDCYVFEGDMNTLCAGVVDGQRALTEAETQALKRHLYAIPRSIRFAPGK
jgi:hypothetical protein